MSPMLEQSRCISDVTITMYFVHLTVILSNYAHDVGC